MKKTAKSWLAASLIASLLFMLVRPQLAAAINSQQIEGLYMAGVGVEVGTVVINGYRQIEYVFENKKRVITEDNHSHADPDTDGEYIVWISQLGPYWQVFRYSLVTEETIQLTTSGNNVNPKVSGERVVWEKQVNGVWQVMMFDGIRVKQLTRGSRPSQDVDVEGDWLVYRQKAAEGWNVYITALLTGRIIDLGEGHNPEFIGDELVWWTQPGEQTIRRTYRFGVEAEPAATPSPEATTEATESATTEPTPEPSPSPELVTEEDILEELEIATPSGEVEEATEAGELE